jgi:hypothetical protein
MSLRFALGGGEIPASQQAATYLPFLFLKLPHIKSCRAILFSGKLPRFLDCRASKVAAQSYYH